MVLVSVIALAFMWPTDWAMDPRLLAVLSGIPQIATAAVAIVALRRSVRAAPLAATAPAAA